MPNSALLNLPRADQTTLLGYYQHLCSDQDNPCLLREHTEDGLIANRQRNFYQRDFARILYSSSFRRLQGKMQILGIEFESFFRNRLTHSLEVLQIAKGIACLLQVFFEGIADTEIYGCDMFVLEAAAIAHDIGHPAFGHSGERILNDLSGDIGFEGNAQNFRILRTLERKFPTTKGLNLTYRTLLSILKYNVQHSRTKKKFLYPDDFDFFQRIVNDYDFRHRTLDVQILDLADEIAYAAHDLEDALSMGYFNIDELVFEFSRLEKCRGCEVLLDGIVSQARDLAKQCNITKSAEEYSHVFKKELTSCLINELINDITLMPVEEASKEKSGTTNDYELGFFTYSDLVEGLKTLTFKCVNQKKNVRVYEKRGEIIIRGLFNLFMDDKDINKDYILLPPEYRPESNAEKNKVVRNVLDYIAGMMDSYAITLYEQYFGRRFCDITFECSKNSIAGNAVDSSLPRPPVA